MSREIYSDAVTSGRNADKELDDYVRCERCGFPCRLSRDQRGSNGSRQGWGIAYTAVDNCAITYDQHEISYDAIDAEISSVKIYPSNIRAYDNCNLYDSEDTYNNFSENDGTLSYDSIKRIYDPVVTAGCPNCGTLLYKGR